MSELQRARFGSLFATPLLEHVWSDGLALNTALRDAILAQASRDVGKTRTNLGGWHSEPGTLDFCGPAGERLIGYMRAMTQEATSRVYAQYDTVLEPLNWVLSAWANVNRKGDSNTMHTHPGATWSGVYYVDDGQSSPDEEATAIVLSDPNPTRTGTFFPDITGTAFQIRPRPGLMILFPSYLPHAVPPHRGDRPRISIAFNVRKEPFP